MITDAEMLQRYARGRDERAFAELVQRHLGMVYGAALRRTGGQKHLDAGAKRVLISAPAKEVDLTVVYGVNAMTFSSFMPDFGA